MINSSAEQRVPADNAFYWIQNKALPAQRIMSGDFSHWTRIEKANINVGPQTAPVWYRIPIKNATQDRIDRVLEIRWINIKSIEFFLQRKNVVESRHYGITRSATLDAAGNSSFLFPFSLEPDEEADLYIYTETQYFSFLPAYIWKADYLEQNQNTRLAWYCLAFGGLLALLLYNLSLSVLTRDRVYYYYCAYVVSIIIYELAFDGLGTQFIWGSNPWVHTHALALGIYLSFFWGSLFLREFVALQKESPWLLWPVNVSALFWLAMLVSLFTLDRFFQFAIYVCIVCCVVALAIPLHLWQKGNQAARFYCYAWSVLLFFTTGILLVVSGYLPFNFFTENGQLFGFLIEMLMFSFALAARINLERMNREKAQAEALSLQLSINQERENTIRLQEQLLEAEKQNNQVLEGKVEERTRELALALVDLQKANQQLSQQSITDGLTGIYNRRYFDEALERELRRAERERYPLSLIMLDIDNFKKLNDNYGHLAGDECLRRFANTLCELLPRASDLIARYGGEEFAVIMPNTDQDAAATIAEKIRNVVEQESIQYEGQQIGITTSLGVVTLGAGISGTGPELIIAADNALYQAKAKGRNRWEVAEPVFAIGESRLA